MHGRWMLREGPHTSIFGAVSVNK